MNIRCPNCQTVFRVDPAKVPAEGIRAKCSRCAHAFRIASPAETAAAAASAAQTAAAPGGAWPAGAGAAPAAGQTAAPYQVPAPAAPAPPGPRLHATPPPTPAAGTLRPGMAPPEPPVGKPPAPTAAVRPATGVTEPAARPAGATGVSPKGPAAGAGSTPRTPVFGSSDPRARAQRIARALVSDIVAYNKKRVEETLASGRLRTEFRDEIMKSWEEYVAQVGVELAKGTPFFRDSLNEILARGQRIF